LTNEKECLIDDWYVPQLDRLVRQGARGHGDDGSRGGGLWRPRALTRSACNTLQTGTCKHRKVVV